MIDSPCVTSIMSSGSGASIIHKNLEARIENYHCRFYNPVLEYFPPLLLAHRQNAGKIVHTPPDHAVLVTPRHANLIITFHGYFLDSQFMPYCTKTQQIHYRTDLCWLYQKALERADVVTAVSQYIADLIYEDLNYSGNVQVIHNGIDTLKFFPQPVIHNNIRVLFCGNLSRRKGGDLLEPIAKQLDAGVELWLASGLHGNKYNLSSPKNIRMLGSINYNDMPALYNQVDIVIVPSFREGFGLVAAEAMASGLPVVASAGSATSELIIDGSGGYLVEPGNVSSFAERINKLAQSSSLRKLMGNFNRKRIESQFTENKMVDEYQTLFSKLLI